MIRQRKKMAMKKLMSREKFTEAIANAQKEESKEDKKKSQPPAKRAKRS